MAQPGIPGAPFTAQPGDMFYLPPRTSPLPGDADAHPYMLVRCDAVGGAHLVLLSSSEAEWTKGAPYHAVQPQTVAGTPNGVKKPSKFFGGVVLAVQLSSVTPHIDREFRLVGELQNVRTSLETALGIGASNFRVARALGPTI